MVQGTGSTGKARSKSAFLHFYLGYRASPMVAGFGYGSVLAYGYSNELRLR